MSTLTPDVSLREKADTPAPKEASTPAEWTEQLDSLHLRSKPDSFMGRLLSERKSLLSRVERAEADSKRMDWLEANACRVIPARSPMPGSVRTVTPDALIIAPTIRECIDVHAAATPQPEESTRE